MPQARGKFIAVDGGDGSGKDTNLELVKRRFESETRDVVFTREPGGSDFAEEIRSLILCNGAKNADANTMFFLFLAARADHVGKLVRPNLEAGTSVVSNRFDASTYAFQIFAQGGDHLRELFVDAHALILGDIRPDMYIYLDVDPAEGARRTFDRGDRTHFDERKLDFHRKVREGYLDFISTRPHRIIDANQAPEAVAVEFQQALCEALG